MQQLWLDSVAAEQFGGAAHKLDTNLTYKSFQKAGAALTAQGLFQFEEVFGRLPSVRPGLISYRVRNLHGYYNRFYWESSTSEETNSDTPPIATSGMFRLTRLEYLEVLLYAIKKA
ncbi:hypothetical protein [Nostoc sp.]|uniref:hypothetical protein n=1 Tax=Nostoc sp. TaxID=1180 RepID=UPI002FF4CA60